MFNYKNIFYYFLFLFFFLLCYNTVISNKLVVCIEKIP